MDLRTGGVIEAVLRLDESLKNLGAESLISDDPKEPVKKPMHCIAHGLWQWPGITAWKNFSSVGTPYLVFPHGMLDPWFKSTFPFKHLKK